MGFIVTPSFALGELSDALSGRVDMDWYGKGLARCRNFTVMPSGGVTLRPGTEFVGEVPAMGRKGRLVPFMFNSDMANTYALLFNDGACYPIQNGGFVCAPGSTDPYSFAFDATETELAEMRCIQSGDTIYVVHPNWPPRKVVRYGNTQWSVAEPTFRPAIAAPTNLTASTSASGSVGYAYKVSSVDAYGNESAPTDAVTLTSKNLGLDDTTITLQWSAATDAAEYKVYKDAGGTYGIVGYVEQGSSDTLSWKDKNYEADLSSTPLTFENPFDSEGNYPSCAGFIQQRLCFAGTRNNPNKLWMSRSGDFENFGRSNPTRDDDAIYLSLYSRQVSWICSLASMRCLVAMTGGTEYTITGNGTDAVITPSDVRALQQSAYGVSGLEPEIVGNSIIMMQRGGHVVRDLVYDYSVDGYQGSDLSIRSQHFLNDHTIISWAYQTTPDGILWAVRDDGRLLSMTYNKEHQIFAWALHETDGAYEDVCCVNGKERDEIYLIVRRTVNGATKRYVERMAEPFRDLTAGDASRSWYVDCGLRLESETPVTVISGLSHLEGKQVSVLADGGPIDGLTVMDGEITLPTAHKTILVGLGYEGIIRTLRVNAGDGLGSSQSRKQKIGTVSLRFDRSIGGEVGWQRYNVDGTVFEEHWVPIKYRTLSVANQASAPYSGDRKITPPTGWDDRGQLMLRQRDPLPLTLLCAILNITIGEK